MERQPYTSSFTNYSKQSLKLNVNICFLLNPFFNNNVMILYIIFIPFTFHVHVLLLNCTVLVL